MRRLLSPGWLVGHAVALVSVAVCLGLGWWQVQRAGEGNVRSYAYAVEWPVFAGFMIFVWLREIRRARTEPAEPEATRDDTDRADPTTATVPPQPDPARAPARSAPAGDEDDELTSYNRMLAWLNANPDRRMSDYPG